MCLNLFKKFGGINFDISWSFPSGEKSRIRLKLRQLSVSSFLIKEDKDFHYELPDNFFVNVDFNEGEEYPRKGAREIEK